MAYQGTALFTGYKDHICIIKCNVTGAFEESRPIRQMQWRKQLGINKMDIHEYVAIGQHKINDTK